MVVTGAGTGIGRAIALRFAADGARLSLLGRRAAPLEETLALAGGGGVALPIAHGPAAREVQTVAAGCFEQHAWCRLPAGAGAVGSTLGKVRVVGAPEDVEELDPCAREELGQARVDVSQGLLGQETSGHAALIGDDHERVARTLQAPERGNHSRQELEILHAPEVVDLPVERAVPVEEDRRPQGAPCGPSQDSRARRTWTREGSSPS